MPSNEAQGLPQNSNVIAAFDVDGTLTQRDTLLQFLWALSTPLEFIWKTVRLSPVLLRYVLGWLPNGTAKERVVSRFVGGRSLSEVQPIAERFARDAMPRLLCPTAQARLRWHLEQGHRVLVVSASLELYLTPWAHAEGVHDVLATRLEVKDGRLTGRFDGSNCYGPEKQRRLEAAVPDLQCAEVHAYGNSTGDRELLEAADYAYYRTFDPDAARRLDRPVRDRSVWDRSGQAHSDQDRSVPDNAHVGGPGSERSDVGPPASDSLADTDHSSAPDSPSDEDDPAHNTGSDSVQCGEAEESFGVGPAARGLIGSLIAGALLYVGLSLWSGADALLQALRQVPLRAVAIVLGLVLSGYFVRFVRWHTYLRQLGASVPWRANLRIFLASFALTATPGKAGESVKAYLLKREYAVPAARSLAGLFTERFTDVFSILLVIALGLATLPHGRWLVLGVGALQVAGLVVLLRPRSIRRALLLPLAGRAARRRWIRPVDAMLTDTARLLRPRLLIGGTLLGGLPWIGEGIALYALFDALGASGISVFDAVLIHAAATLFGALTFLPGGLGGHEAASISLTLAYGASQPVAVAATLLIRLMTLWFAVALGVLVFAVHVGRTSDPPSQ